MFSWFSKRFKDPQSTEHDINLLLLGETGVGKSTFINSISNYFNFPNFKAAQKGKINVLIPVRLNLANSSKIYGDPDKNESHENGAAATQHVKVYLFPIKMDGKVINLRLVDTPGVGDPRGLEQDNENLDNILAYLATLKKLHGICLLMKANNSRFTKFVEYCLKEILSRLDKSASSNIIFITTYSKIAQYSAGETKIHCLEKLVDSIKSRPPHVSIPLNKLNTFCLDNEAFRALLEMKEGKKLKKHEIESLSESWTVSSHECRRLLTYLIGDSKTKPLKPHEVENTISVNEVRFLIEQLAIPIAEVSENIQDNLMILDRHKKNLSRENQSLSELKQQLFIPCVELRVKELSQPVTVCTDTKCADIVKVNEVTQWHYKQRCHNPCYLDGIPREMVGDPGLVNCAAMSGTENCNQCGCHYKVHMHIYKETEKVQSQREDENVKDAIKSKENIRDQIEQVVKQVNKIMGELEKEGEIISESVAKFSYFLQEHALTPFNDAYTDYIKQLIKNEKHLGKLADPAVIEKLQKLLYKHEQLQKTFQESQNKFQPGEFDLSPISIKQSINELYDLKHMGKKIEELIEKSSACRHSEIQKNFNCVVSQQIDWNANKVLEPVEYQKSAYQSDAYDEYYYTDINSRNYESDFYTSDYTTGSKKERVSSRPKFTKPEEPYYSEYYYSTNDNESHHKYQSSSDEYQDLDPSYRQLNDSDDQKSVISSRSKASSGRSHKSKHRSKDAVEKSSRNDYTSSSKLSRKPSINSSRNDYAIDNSYSDRTSGSRRSHRRRHNREHTDNYPRRELQEKHSRKKSDEYSSGNYASRPSHSTKDNSEHTVYYTKYEDPYYDSGEYSKRRHRSHHEPRHNEASDKHRSPISQFYADKAARQKVTRSESRRSHQHQQNNSSEKPSRSPSPSTYSEYSFVKRKTDESGSSTEEEFDCVKNEE